MGKCREALKLFLLLISLIVSVLEIDDSMAQSNMIVVPDDFPTIQEAIDDADEGGTIFVRSGNYFENLVINKSIYLTGENPNTTIIDGNYAQVNNVVEVKSDNVKITGFTIQKSGGVKYYERAGIYIDDSNSNNISYNMIADNYGNGIRLEGS